IKRDYRRRSGRRRYSEWRIDERQNVFAFAMAEAKSEGHALRFTTEGSYVPILSEYSALAARRGQGTTGVFLTLGSLLCFSFGILCFCFALRIHRVLVFLSIVSALNVFALFIMGLSMMSVDLKDGYERLERHQRSAQGAVETILGSGFKWASLPRRVQGTQDAKLARILGIREDLSAAIERTNAILERFPENWLAPMWGISPHPSILAPGEKPSSEANIVPSPISGWVSWIGGILALACGMWGSIYGFRRIKTKRYIENVPTSLSSGLAYGPAEIKGKLELIEGQVLKGPLSKQKCSYYRYRVTERRGSGKNRRTVVIEDRNERVKFFCRDREGATLVDPEGADVTAEVKKTRRSGRRTYREWNLAPGEDLYLLGSAVVEPERGESLQLADGDNDGFPFLISSESETDTMLRQSRAGLSRISLGFSGIVLLVLLLFASTGSYAATDFLASSLTAPFFLVFSTFALMFNDLVFLRNRIKRAWANIEVSLKKRVDLIPNLESVAKAYLKHEKEIHLDIVNLRNSVKGKKSFSPSDFDSAMQAETAVTHRLIGLVEAYPNLKGDTLMRELMTSLTPMENEVAFMRAGYNDSVELYRTTIRRVPEVFLAKMFHFEDAQFLQTDVKVHTLPEIGFDQPEASPEAEVPEAEVPEPQDNDPPAEPPPPEATPTPSPSGIEEEEPQLSGTLLVERNERQYGPFSVADAKKYLGTGQLSEIDSACWEGQSEWLPLKQLLSGEVPPPPGEEQKTEKGPPASAPEEPPSQA
ncbi:MAG: LemA family protein, partial [Opitutales bacterium]